MEHELLVGPYPAAGSLSTLSVRYPRFASSKATAAPITPAPMTTASAFLLMRSSVVSNVDFLDISADRTPRDVEPSPLRPEAGVSGSRARLRGATRRRRRPRRATTRELLQRRGSAASRRCARCAPPPPGARLRAPDGTR